MIYSRLKRRQALRWRQRRPGGRRITVKYWRSMRSKSRRRRNSNRRIRIKESIRKEIVEEAWRKHKKDQLDRYV
jgi:hypothetical protein